MARNTPASRRRWWFVIGLLLVGIAVLLMVRPRSRKTDATPPVAAEVTPRPAVTSAPPATAPNMAILDPVAAPTGQPAGSQMRAMIFEMDGSGIHLRQSSIANGRVKAPPISNSPRRVEFEVYGPDASVIYAGAFDDPRWARAESVNDKGEFTAAEERQLSNGSCLVRIPAELPATRIEFFRVDAMWGNAVRQSIGSFPLP